MLEGVAGLFSTMCHQNPGRSYLLAGGIELICCRCLGMYLGSLCGIIALILSAIRRAPVSHSVLWVYFAGLAVTPAEVLAEAHDWSLGSNEVRFVLGVLSGFCLVGLLWFSPTPCLPGRKSRFPGVAAVSLLVLATLAFFCLARGSQASVFCSWSLAALATLGVMSLTMSIVMAVVRIGSYAVEGLKHDEPESEQHHAVG